MPQMANTSMCCTFNKHVFTYLWPQFAWVLLVSEVLTAALAEKLAALALPGILPPGTACEDGSAECIIASSHTLQRTLPSQVLQNTTGENATRSRGNSAQGPPQLSRDFACCGKMPFSRHLAWYDACCQFFVALRTSKQLNGFVHMFKMRDHLLECHLLGALPPL